jgi:hypothetical protein
MHRAKSQWAHHKNIWGFNQLAAYAREMGFVKDDVSLVWCPARPSLDEFASVSDKTTVVFGPHFSVFPDSTLGRLPRVLNAVYIQPSAWSKLCWDETIQRKLTDVRTVLFVVAPFPVDVHTFKPEAPRVGNSVLVYAKQRSEHDVHAAVAAVTAAGGTPVVLRYGSYTEKEYIELLQRCVCGVWVGSHESQGFALQEALATNLPLLVWDMGCVVHGGCPLRTPHGVLCAAQSAPYFDGRCGTIVGSAQEMAAAFCAFFEAAKKGTVFSPRDFVLQHLDVEPVFMRYWAPLLPPRPA